MTEQLTVVAHLRALNGQSKNWLIATAAWEWDKHMEMPHLQTIRRGQGQVFELQKLRLMTMIGDSVSKR